MRSQANIRVATVLLTLGLCMCAPSAQGTWSEQLRRRWRALRSLAHSRGFHSTQDFAVESRFPLRLSSHKCTNDADPRSNVCVFSNLLRWNNRLYYITDGSQVVLPSARVSPKFPDVALADVMEVASKEVFDRMAAAVTEHEHVDRGLLFRPELVVNWWHSMDDALSMYWSMCQGLGVCEYLPTEAERSALLVLSPRFPLNLMESEWRGRGYNSVRHLFQCFGARFINVGSREVEERNHENLMPHKVFTFGQVAVGLGIAGHPHKAEKWGLKRPTPQQWVDMTGYLRQCAGLPRDAPGPAGKKDPTVVMFNRAYTAGRSMVRLDELLYRVRTARPSANVMTTFLEGVGFAEQARAFAGADVVVLAHGAACANLMFLPRLAAVVHVSHSPAHQLFPDEIISSIPPPYEVINIPYMRSDENATEPITVKLRHSEEMRRLAGDPATALEYAVGPGHVFERMEARMANYLLDVEEMEEKVVRAIDEWTVRAQQLQAP